MSKPDSQNASALDGGNTRFPGFHLPTSNTLYCPNQFFDVCLPHRSRPCVRLVGFMLRQTLGWSDQEGNPVEEDHRFSWNQLIERAGISRGSLKEAIHEAVEHGFIEQKVVGRANGPDQSFQSSVFTLRWNTTGPYTTDPNQFQGFFGGEGNRTYIPLQFFDHVVRNEPLGVTKVVGAIIRFSIGFQTVHGFRRQKAQLSVTSIQRYTRQDRKTVRQSLAAAIQTGYICCTERGIFDTNAGKRSVAASYALRWQRPLAKRAVQESPRAIQGIGSKIRTANSSEQFKHPHGSGPRIPTEERFTNPHDRNNKENNHSKQPAGIAGDPFKDREVIDLLLNEGFSLNVAGSLAAHGREVITRQIAWIERRKPKNRAAMLRRAIEGDWTEPAAAHPTSDASGEFIRAFYAARAGHREQSLVQPSHREVSLATPLLRRLAELELNGIEREPAKLGREFGRFVRYETRKQPQFAQTFSGAHHAFADAFYAASLPRRPAPSPQEDADPKSIDPGKRRELLDQIRQDLAAKGIVTSRRR